MAKSSLRRLRVRLEKNTELYKGYKDFLEEYQELGHMSPVPKLEEKSSFRVFLPHHGVVREDSSTTNLRVVFNASANTSSGVSLNDIMYPGPKLQNEITSVITNWRLHPFVYKADIEKMFRQILIRPEERALQCILWQELSQTEPTIYELNTVSFGTVSAPFLAMRVIQQAVQDHGKDFPLAVEPLIKLIYVDDVLFGAGDLQALADKKHQICELLEKAGYKLRKWASNVPELSESHLISEPFTNSTVAIKVESKVLGISWDSTEDQFLIDYSPSESSGVTKRSILSCIARLYDPLGWSKIILQELWIAKLDWDDPVSESVERKWRQYLDSFVHLSQIRISRWIHFISDSTQLQLIGFCDASSKAYSAAVYARTIDSKGIIQANLLMAKSKIAPLKTLSIPRLELCGAVLLTKLLVYLKQSLAAPVASMHGYTDSKIVLAWLSKAPATWEVFVANRVSFAQTELPEVRWAHVGTKFNPADLNSRGISAMELPNASLWWKGPSWLWNDPLPGENEFYETDSGARKKRVASHATNLEELSFIQNFSSWSRLLRVTAFVLKYISKLKDRVDKRSFGPRGSAHVLSKELLLKAETVLIHRVQRREFSSDVSSLEKEAVLPRDSRILALSPFLDGNGLLRVGGRLENSTLSFGEKHPLILDKVHLSLLLIRQTHLNALHSGVQLTLQILRSKYWILNARNLVKSVIHACVTCTRQKAELACQKMGQLPADRCSPGRAFSHVGVD